MSVSGCSKHPDPTGVYKLSLASEEVTYDLRSDGQAVYASQFTLPDGAAGRTDGVGTWRFSNGSLIVETDRETKISPSSSGYLKKGSEKAAFTVESNGDLVLVPTDPNRKARRYTKQR